MVKCEEDGPGSCILKVVAIRGCWFSFRSQTVSYVFISHSPDHLNMPHKEFSRIAWLTSWMGFVWLPRKTSVVKKTWGLFGEIRTLEFIIYAVCTGPESGYTRKVVMWPFFFFFSFGRSWGSYLELLIFPLHFWIMDLTLSSFGLRTLACDCGTACSVRTSKRFSVLFCFAFETRAVPFLVKQNFVCFSWLEFFPSGFFTFCLLNLFYKGFQSPHTILIVHFT